MCSGEKTYGTHTGVIILEMVDREIGPFCAMWQLEKDDRPSISLSNSNAYLPKANRVFLSPEVAQSCAKTLTDQPSLEYQLKVLSAQTSLYHEMTHAVQRKMMGTAWIYGNRLLSEIHADVFSGYWLADKLTQGILENLTTLARTKLEGNSSEEYLDLCERIYSILEGIEIGKRTLAKHGCLQLEHCARSEVMTDSLDTAMQQMENKVKPCNRVYPKLDWINRPCCEGCPNAEFRDEFMPGTTASSYRNPGTTGSEE